MRIPLKINHNSVTVNCEPDQPLAFVLRNLNLFSVKCGCGKGLCGVCTVLIDEKSVPSCLIPVSAVKDQNIITLEHFMKTDAYSDISQAFEKNDVKLCGFCNAGRIFAIHEILEQSQRPEKQLIGEFLRTFSCPCTEDDLLVKTALTAADIRRKRLGSIKYGLR
ncbi:2Fe-2S iron-sulfur cluster binding domain-containing protein [Treponema sp. OMZ 840]|uniref:(2Fe-2S)-binding protein n=1 Tax=Treponema sp. OMZ 840 TaxID=244313 RepID=UPI003D927D2F